MNCKAKHTYQRERDLGVESFNALEVVLTFEIERVSEIEDNKGVEILLGLHK